VFGVSSGKVLGCLVSVKGIEANPDKINAIVHLKPPGSRKELQRLTGRIAALNRFMAKNSRAKLTILQGTKRLRHFRVGVRTTRGFRGTKGVHTKVTNVSKSIARLTTHSVCVDNAYYSQRSPSTRKRDKDRRQKVIAPSPNIYCFQRFDWLKEILLGDEKDILCRSHERKDASTLF
jgi:hypothetical protein